MTRWMLAKSGDGWQLAQLDGDRPQCRPLAASDSNIEDLVAAVSQITTAAGSVVVALDAASVMTGTFDLGGNDTRNRRTLMYQFEGLLPFAAEDLVADFVTHRESVFGVALECSRWAPLVAALEDQNLNVVSIAPLPLLALESLERSVLEDHQCILWRESDAVEVFRVEGGRVLAWRHLAGDPSIIRQRLAAELADFDAPPAVALVNPDEGIRQIVQQLEIAVNEIPASGMLPAAVGPAVAVAAGGSTAIELRREGLTAGDPHRSIRGSVRLAVATAVVLALSVIAVCWIKIGENQRLRDQLVSRQEALYLKAFPDSRVPTGIVSRLRSERARLAGAKGAAGTVQWPTSPLAILHDTLEALPERVRFHVRELRIEDGQVDVDVDVKTHNAASQLAGALRSGGFEVDPPATVQQSDQSVSTRIYGRPAGQNTEGTLP